MINSKRMTTIALTEHVPRPTEHLYPDEEADGWTTEKLSQMFHNFVQEAKQLRQDLEKNHPNVHLLIGFEAEWIDEAPHVASQRIQDILTQYSDSFDVWIGSVHHVKTEPIDYDVASYQRALAKFEGDEEALCCSYFDAQYELLSRRHPPIVGHFDLVRLKSKEPDKNWKSMRNVWQRIVRNLELIKEYGGLIEVNGSALRKGLGQPYPRGEIVTEWNAMGGTVVLSDDSHGIDHVGACYDQIMEFFRELNISTIGFMKQSKISKSGLVLIEKAHLKELLQHPFWINED